MEDTFFDAPDVKRQRLLLHDSTPVLVVYVDGLVDLNLLQRDILQGLLQQTSDSIFSEPLKTANFTATDSMVTDDLDKAMTYILNGWPAIFINGYDSVILINLSKSEKRPISAPTMEKNVKGPQEAFVESIGTNLSILRKRIRNNRLKFKLLSLGDLTHQIVIIAYIEGITNPKILDTMYNKLVNIHYDGLLGIGYIEQLIADNQITPFPHYLSTERPDRVVAGLLEGQIAVILDGTPYALLAPVTFFSFLQAPDDYYGSWIVHSLNRLLRFLALIIALFLPALYIAIVSYHYYMIPLNLLIPLAESRAKVPFPPIIEVLILETTLEMLREATIRLPTFIANSIGVVGGLIIGQAAVSAGVVSNIIIIVVAITAIASFIIPNYDMSLSIRYTRFIVMFFASIFGIIGVVICSMFILAHLVVLESLGEPYLKPLLPFSRRDFKDTLLRPALRRLRTRPSMAHPVDKTRGKKNG